MYRKDINKMINKERLNKMSIIVLIILIGLYLITKSNIIKWILYIISLIYLSIFFFGLGVTISVTSDFIKFIGGLQ